MSTNNATTEELTRRVQHMKAMKAKAFVATEPCNHSKYEYRKVAIGNDVIDEGDLAMNGNLVQNGWFIEKDAEYHRFINDFNTSEFTDERYIITYRRLNKL